MAIWLNLTTALVVAGLLVLPVRRLNHTPEGRAAAVPDPTF
jgi:hypothetical protein